MAILCSNIRVAVLLTVAICLEHIYLILLLLSLLQGVLVLPFGLPSLSLKVLNLALGYG